MKLDFSSKDVNYWLGTQASLFKVLEAQAAMAGKPCTDEEEEKEQHRLLSVEKDVGIINVQGSLTSTDAWYNKYYGITSYNEIRNAIVEAVEDEDISRILLDVDSPGGDAKGVSDLADFIKKAAKLKPIDVHVSGTAFSAAYWIASATDSITGPKMSEAGSIGVIAILAEYTVMFKKQGINVHVFRGGKYKALGNPYEKLSAKAIKLIQEKIDKMEGFFLDAVSENRGIPRGKAKAQVGEGLTFFAEEAVLNGLMDEILTFDELFSRLIKLSNSNTAARKVLNEDTIMKKKVLTEASVGALAAGATEEEVAALQEEQEQAAEDESTSTSAEEGTDEGGEEAASEESEETSASAEESSEESEETSDTKANDTDLVAFLKDEVKTLRAENATLTASAGNVEALQANETALKKLASQYIEHMCAPLGITAMNMTGMETGVLLAQYTEIRSKFVARFPVGAHAEVQDEEPESSKQGFSHMTKAAIKANEI